MADVPRNEEHREVLHREFSRQAAAFEDRRINRVFTSDAQWVFERLPRGEQDLVLDVAAGTGHAARQLARDVRAVVAVDTTVEMLVRGREAALAEGADNVVFALGDAEALPFLDESFDIVCRFALHHFPDAAGPLSEMGRCLRRAGGRVAVADLVADPRPEVAAVQNELERLRDPSHTRMLPVAELVELFVRVGLAEPDVVTRSVARPLGPWLEQTGAAEEVASSIRGRLDAEVDRGGDETGFAPRRVEGELWFTQTFASCVAEV